MLDGTAEQHKGVVNWGRHRAEITPLLEHGGNQRPEGDSESQSCHWSALGEVQLHAAFYSVFVTMPQLICSSTWLTT